MTTLVTGATGLVGTHLVDALRQRGEAVRALVRDTAKVPAHWGQGVEIAVGDVTDRQSLKAAAADVGTIYHCAAASSLSSEEEIRRTNLDGLRNVLDAARAAKAGRVIVMSSLNVLGNRNFDGATEDLPSQRQGDVHADVKIDGEELALRYHREHGQDVTILRAGLIYGPGERHLPKLGKAIARGKFVFIGSRDNVVPLLHVSDMAQAMILAAHSPDAAGRVYHITDGSRTTIGELADTLAEVLGYTKPAKTLPYFLPWLLSKICGLVGVKGPINATSLRFLGRSRHVDIRRAREELGYSPKVGLQQGMAASAGWLKEAIAAELAKEEAKKGQT
jgi:nucleoside-diphosphate-sugar epimerase